MKLVIAIPETNAAITFQHIKQRFLDAQEAQDTAEANDDWDVVEDYRQDKIDAALDLADLIFFGAEIES